MKILLIAPEFPPASDPSGDRYAYELALGLKDEGQEIEIIALSQDKAGVEVLDGIKVHRVVVDTTPDEKAPVMQGIPNSRSALRLCAAIWRKCNELSSKSSFDVVDCPQFIPLGLMSELTASLPTVVRYVSGKPQESPYLFDRQLALFGRNLSLVTANKIISPSQDISETLSAELSIAAEKITTIDGQLNTLNRRQLAKQTIAAYQDATTAFRTAISNKSPLYRKGSEQFLADYQSMSGLWDSMIYNLFYQESFRFRIRHRINMLKHNRTEFVHKLKKKLGLVSARS